MRIGSIRQISDGGQNMFVIAAPLPARALMLVLAPRGLPLVHSDDEPPGRPAFALFARHVTSEGP